MDGAIFWPCISVALPPPVNFSADALECIVTIK